MYRSAARMLWAIYLRRFTRTTAPQRHTMFSVWEDLIRADTLLFLPTKR